MDVLDALQSVVLLQGHRVEVRHRADAGERGLQFAERRCRRLGARVLVLGEHRGTVAVWDRNHGFREVTAGPHVRGPLLGPDGVRVHVLARETVDGRDQVGTDALRHEVRVERGLRIRGHGAAVAAHRHT
ncbi:hypothetical protein GCM10010372_51700 [Streptomyces tauricus]|nr:hypothetical protein GCM10010372_51700 [Streptomyces tauricus]